MINRLFFLLYPGFSVSLRRILVQLCPPCRIVSAPIDTTSKTRLYYLCNLYAKERVITHSASFFRLKQLLRRAAAGEELTVGFLGGSITQGSLSSTPETCYAFRVYRWFVRAFPQAAFHYVNAGIGGTDSLYGVSRAVSDLLMYQPDFVVVDFSVNDIDLPFRKETYEGILRRVLSWPSAPAVVLLCNIYYDTGLTAEDDHVEIGEHYGVPHVSIRDSIYKDLHAGRYARRELLSPDGLHPNDFGHELVASEITKLLDAVNARRDEPEAVPPFPAPQTVNAYENARRLTIREVSPRLQGFRADPAEKTGHLDAWKNGWIGAHPGDAVTFTVEASCIAVQYRKTIRRPALTARLVLDGDTAHAVLLGANFAEDWGDCQYLQPILHHGEQKLHTVELTILPCAAADAAPFYLQSLVIA